MSKRELSRRNMFGASALGAASAAAAALADPGQAAAQAVGVKKADLPDLTIKEVKVYVADIGNVRRLNNTETGEIVSIVTNSGIEGNMTIGNRGNPPGFLEYAKRRVLGKSALDVTSITPVPNTRRFSAYGALTPARGFPPDLRPEAPQAGGGRGAAGAIPATMRSPGRWPRPAAARPARAELHARRHHRRLSVGHPRQGRKPAHLPAPGRHQDPRDGLRQLAAPAHGRGLRPRRSEG